MVLERNALGGGPPPRDPPLHVIVMAIALVLAAFLGAAVGLVWQSSGLGDEPQESGDGAAPVEEGEQ